MGEHGTALFFWFDKIFWEFFKSVNMHLHAHNKKTIWFACFVKFPHKSTFQKMN